MVDGDNLVNTRVDKAGIVIDLSHIITTIKFKFAGTDSGPLVIAAFNETFTDKGDGTGNNNTAGIAGINNNGTTGFARGVSDRHDG